MWDEELLRSLEAALRRPGEIFSDEWEGYRPRHPGPGISTVWAMGFRDDAPNEVWELEDEMSMAWDELCDDDAFAAWVDEHRVTLRGEDAFNELIVDAGARESLRFSRTGNLIMHVPVEPLRTSRPPREEFRRIILAMLTKRATRAGLAPPPV